MMQGQGDKLRMKLVTHVAIERREKIRKDVDEEILKFLRAKNKYHEPVDMVCCQEVVGKLRVYVSEVYCSTRKNLYSYCYKHPSIAEDERMISQIAF